MKLNFLKSAVLLLSIATPGMLLAQDGGGEATYKQKCGTCHGADGAGKMGPALKGTKLSEDDVLLIISKGKEGAKAPHAKPISGLTDEQLKAVAHYVKSLK